MEKEPPTIYDMLEAMNLMEREAFENKYKNKCLRFIRDDDKLYPYTGVGDTEYYNIFRPLFTDTVTSVSLYREGTPVKLKGRAAEKCIQELIGLVVDAKHRGRQEITLDFKVESKVLFNDNLEDVLAVALLYAEDYPEGKELYLD